MGGHSRRPIPPVAHRVRFRALLRVHRWRGQPVLSRALRGHHCRRAAEITGGGIHPHRGSRRPRDHLGAPAEGADAGQAVLRILRPRGHPRATSRPEGVVRQVQGQVRRRLGRASRAVAGAAEEAGRGAEGCETHGAPRRNPVLERHARRNAPRAGSADGDLRRLPGADRPRGGPRHRRDRRPRHSGRHPRSTTSSATTVPRPRARSTVASTRWPR